MDRDKAIEIMTQLIDAAVAGGIIKNLETVNAVSMAFSVLVGTVPNSEPQTAKNAIGKSKAK